LLATGCKKDGLSDDKIEGYLNDIEAIESQISEHTAVWSEAVSIASNVPVLPALAGPCEIEMPWAISSDYDLSRYLVYERAVSPGEVPPFVQSISWKVSSLKNSLGSDHPPRRLSVEHQDIIGGYADPTWWGHDVAIVANEYIAPELAGPNFVPGRLRGRAFVWSYAEDAIVCAAEIDATNADTIMVDTNDPGRERYLQNDLYAQAAFQARESVRSLAGDGSTTTDPAPAPAVEPAHANPPPDVPLGTTPQLPSVVPPAIGQPTGLPAGLPTGSPSQLGQ